jgi:hypothetical protein
LDGSKNPKGKNMDSLDELIRAERGIKKTVDYVKMFKTDPQVVDYIPESRARYAAAVESRNKIAGDMGKISYLVHSGKDMRFRGVRDLVNLLEEFDSSCAALLKFQEGESWLQNLSAHQFSPYHVHDWREVMIYHMLSELKEFFQGCWPLAGKFKEIHERATWIIKDISEKNPRPLIEGIASHGYEPVMPAPKPSHQTPLSPLDD